MIGSIETEPGPASFRSTNGLYFQIASLPETAGTSTNWAAVRRVFLEADLLCGFSIAIRRIAVANSELHIAEQVTTERLAVLASLAQEWRKRESQAAMAL